MRNQYRILSARFGSLPSLLLALLVTLAPTVARGSAAGRSQEGRRDGDARTQPADSASPEMKAFRDGREALADERWARAEERFNDFITDYPGDRNVDAALYWLAFALKKQEKFAEADRILGRLMKEFPSSNWTGDAQSMRIEIAPQLGGDGRAATAEGGVQPGSEEARLVALRALFKTDPAQALARAGDIFRPGSDASRGFKESAIMLLGRHGDGQATAVLTEIARNESEPRLRKAAIFWLGKSGDDSALGLLREYALSSDEEIGLASLSALLQHGSQQAIETIGEVTAGAKSPEVRRRAGSLLGTAATSAGVGKMKGVWLLIKERNQLLIVPAGRVVRLVGSGDLRFRQDGRLIEIPRGASLTVNGRPIFREREVGRGETAEVVNNEVLSRERVVREGEVVRVVGAGNRVLWELDLQPEGQPATPPDGRDWLTINGEFSVTAGASRTMLLYPRPGGGLLLKR